MISEPISHFVVMWLYDNHHDFYGVFSSVELAIESMQAETDPFRKAQLHLNHSIYEYNGTKVVDEIAVSDVADLDRDVAVRDVIERHKYGGRR